ncbi:unnamed protein product [Enterobius vermicularis]|uniref:G_PROTEIN_RECEP_F1_2 domain-containing protein n=1 Tax=Enterobius vermicularis TaxID=51028 RepID=A0A0N4V1Y8_ENTVE|nr:unnamed protein product [Enterobius vermicularis]
MKHIEENYQHNETVLRMAAEFACTHFGSITPLLDLHCQEFPVNHGIAIQIFVAAAFFLIIVVGILGNAVVMWIIVAHKLMRRRFNYFLFNMAFADCLTVILNVGTTWTFNFYYDWWFGNFCAINLLMSVALTCVSVFTMIIVSWDRCHAIVFPFSSKPLLNRHSKWLIGGIWFAALVIASPNAIYATVEKHFFFSPKLQVLQTHWICKSDFKCKTIYETFILLVQYVIPLFILSITYGSIAWIIQRENEEYKRKGKQPAQFEAKKKVIKMLGLVVTVFMICWLPYQLYHALFDNLFDKFNEFKVSYYTYLIAYWLAMSAAAYNPFIYCLSNNRFRVGFKYAFRWLPFVHCSNEEYEASELFPEKPAARLSIQSRDTATRRGYLNKSLHTSSLDS